MATFTKFYSFTEALAEKKHNLGSDVLTVALTNTAPTTANTQLSDITQVSYTNCSTRALTISSSLQTSGVYKLTIADLSLSATGTVGPFRYIVVYNDTATNDELIGYYDYGSSLTLNNGDTFIIDFSSSTGFITLT